MHVVSLSLSNNISLLDTLGIQRFRKAVHKWVQKADLQSDGGENPNQVVLDESVIRINDRQYWLYAAVDPATNRFSDLPVQFFQNGVNQNLLWKSSAGNMTLKTLCLSSVMRTGSKQHCNDTSSISDTNSTEIGIVSNVSFEI
jgi:hypothetical protein